MKTLAAVAFVSGLAIASASYAADVRVDNVFVKATHAGTHLLCFQTKDGQWYAIPASNGSGYQVQAVAVLLGHADGTPISFFADAAAIDPETGKTYVCHGVTPASWAHDIDQ